MNTQRRRVARLLSDLEAAGGRLVCDGPTIRAEGVDWEWLPAWIDRHKPDLLALLRRRERHRISNPA